MFCILEMILLDACCIMDAFKDYLDVVLIDIIDSLMGKTLLS